jgi:chromosome segregation ATPase
MRATLCAVVLILVGGMGAVRPIAQSLGDVAKKEEERRKDAKSHAKVYTNKDLGAPIQGGSPESATPAAPATPSEASSDDKAKDSTLKDQAYWSKRKKDLQDALSRGKTQADAMQTKVNALTADFSSRDDPIQRASIGRDRQHALAELAHLQQDIKDNQKALSDLDEEARKAGVPPGWLR